MRASLKSSVPSTYDPCSTRTTQRRAVGMFRRLLKAIDWPGAELAGGILVSVSSP